MAVDMIARMMALDAAQQGGGGSGGLVRKRTTISATVPKYNAGHINISESDLPDDFVGAFNALFAASYNSGGTFLNSYLPLAMSADPYLYKVYLYKFNGDTPSFAFADMPAVGTNIRLTFDYLAKE